MSCYLPLLQRWTKPKKRQPREVELIKPDPVAKEPYVHPSLPDNNHVHAKRDRTGVTLSQGMGDFPHQVLLNIRHNHPTLGLDDVAYQRLHLYHTHQSRQQREEAGVVSLGLPLGISSLKLSSNKSKKHKNRRKSGHASDGEVIMARSRRSAGEREGSWEAEPRSRIPSIPAEKTEETRRRSLPRRVKIPSSYHVHQHARPLSVDAALLLGSRHGHGIGGGDQSSTTGGRLEDPFASSAKFASLTSPQDYMAAQEGEKSSSGNSSGSDLTWEGSPHPPDLHPALRGRGQVEVALATRGPPPKHLLPKKLKPSPTQKLHPLVILSPEVRKGKLFLIISIKKIKGTFIFIILLIIIHIYIQN